MPRGPNRPTTVMPRTETQRFYQLYFQTPGDAESELEKDVHNTMVRTIFGLSGDAAASAESIVMLPNDGGWLDGKLTTQSLPAWLTENDLRFYVEEFKRAGFRGGLNWYRNADLNWELLAPWSGAKVQVPALYVVGDRDLVYGTPRWNQFIPSLKQFVPLLRETIILKGCGHCTQEERVHDVNHALLEFLKQN
jgi:pimeloyl-ACP methyl ester carboxylesterase